MGKSKKLRRTHINQEKREEEELVVNLDIA
jgi:hypothetical protein